MQTQRPLGTLRLVFGVGSALDDSFGDIAFLRKFHVYQSRFNFGLSEALQTQLYSAQTHGSGLHVSCT